MSLIYYLSLPSPQCFLKCQFIFIHTVCKVTCLHFISKLRAMLGIGFSLSIRVLIPLGFLLPSSISPQLHLSTTQFVIKPNTLEINQIYETILKQMVKDLENYAWI